MVRWAPNELSFASGEAWKDIYDRGKDGKVLIKDPLFYRTDDTVRAKHIVSTADPSEHVQMRKMMISHLSISKSLNLPFVAFQSDRTASRMPSLPAPS